jgi:hypothetical protein
MCQRTSKNRDRTRVAGASATAAVGRIKTKEQNVIVINSDDEDDRKPSAVATNGNVVFLLDDDSSVENGILSPPRHGIDERKPASKSNKRKISTEQSDRELAERLQQQEKQQADKEKRAARRLRETQQADEIMAQKLQQQEDYVSKKASPGTELKEMTTSSYGRAIIAVQEIIAFVNEAKTTHPLLTQYNVDAVAQDDMVFLAKQMLDLREEFKKKNLPSSIDVGYHYTNQSSMSHIRTNGLLTKADRESKSVVSHFHGSVFGDGIYTSNNAAAFSNYGDVGLLVGRLKGKAGEFINLGFVSLVSLFGYYFVDLTLF